MFERFASEARQVVIAAQQEARGLGHAFIGTEHILLGLLREDDGVAARALADAGLALDPVRAEVAALVGARAQVVDAQQIPFTPRAKKTLELALRESLALGHHAITAEHILLGLLREGEGVAARVLTDHGIDGETLRQQVIGLVGSGPRIAMPSSGLPRSPGRAMSGWLDGFAWLLDELGADIRRELGREPDAGDLLLVLACAEDTLAGQALAALSIDRDALWATIEQARGRAARTTQELERELEETSQGKERAIEEQRFQDAARLRDRERELRRLTHRPGPQHGEALALARRHLGLS